MDRPHILIVEDDVLTRNALFALFAARGLDVIMTGTVAGGLARLDPPPECLILDLMLPDGGGETVLHAVRAGGLPTRVVVCTGTGDRGRLAALGPLKPDAVLPKPVRFEDVLGVCVTPGSG